MITVTEGLPPTSAHRHERTSGSRQTGERSRPQRGMSGRRVGTRRRRQASTSAKEAAPVMICRAVSSGLRSEVSNHHPTVP